MVVETRNMTPNLDRSFVASCLNHRDADQTAVRKCFEKPVLLQKESGRPRLSILLLRSDEARYFQQKRGTCQCSDFRIVIGGGDFNYIRPNQVHAAQLADE